MQAAMVSHNPTQVTSGTAGIGKPLVSRKSSHPTDTSFYSDNVRQGEVVRMSTTALYQRPTVEPIQFVGSQVVMKLEAMETDRLYSFTYKGKRMAASKDSKGVGHLYEIK